MKTKLDIKSYIGITTTPFFRIPAYQRGYKWSVSDGKKQSSVEVLLDNIINAMQSGKEEYFIQGITVCEDNTDIILIDGQQRTTTLFLLLNLLFSLEEKLKYFFHKGEFKLKYDIRKSSHLYLKAQCGNDEFDEKEKNTQDIHYFDLAVKQMESKLKDSIREELKEYILSNVKIFYVKIPLEQATNAFSLLNGAKAFMKTDELIKAEFLCKASASREKEPPSRNIKETMRILEHQLSKDWEINALRSMLARQWDKWLYWWNRQDVKTFFRSGNNPMGLLLEFFFEEKNNKSVIGYSNKEDDVAAVFKAFQNLLIKNSVDAKKNFEKLRKLQKQFEDLFAIPELYNHLGLALIKTDNRKKTIRFFLKHLKEPKLLRSYALLSLVGNIRQSEINDYLLSNNKEKQDKAKQSIAEKIKTMYSLLGQSSIYWGEKGEMEHAYRQLFRLNVEAANERKVKFEFLVHNGNRLTNFYDARSLEHIWPKSRIVFYNEQQEECSIDEAGNPVPPLSVNDRNVLHRKDFPGGCTEHCIGNLVFLHKNDNSIFNAKLPEDKKTLYFDLNKKLFSRNLLHTMSVFAKNWNKGSAIQNIKENKEKVLKDIREGYKDYE